MATKAKIFVSQHNKTMDGYQFDSNLGLVLDDGLWKGVHLRTGNWVCGPSGSFKRKRSCLIFIETVSNLNWDVTSEEELYAANNGFDALVPLYKEAVTKALEAE